MIPSGFFIGSDPLWCPTFRLQGLKVGRFIFKLMIFRMEGGLML